MDKRTLPIPLATLSENADTMYRWLGSFWSTLFEEPELIRQQQRGNSLLSAQLYLNFLETMNVSDSTTGPVYHRELFHLITLDVDKRNTGKAAAIQFGGMYTPVIGPQVNAPFQSGEQFPIGGHMAVQGTVTYPVADDIADVLTSLMDDLVNPQHVLVRDVDFRIENNTLFFLNGNDPLALGFPTQTIQNADGSETTQIAMWGADVLFDKDYVFNYLGYAIGIQDQSSEFYANYLSALWKLYASGATKSLFTSGIGALLDEPYILESRERVEQIIPATDTTSALQVVTDQHVYNVSSLATLRPEVQVGAQLSQGVLLTDTIRVYDNIDPSRLTAGGNDADRFREDTAALMLPPGMIRARIRRGLGITWDLQDLTYEGDDANGNPKLKFTIFGSETDVDLFWEDFWEWCETRNINGETCFTDYLHGTLIKNEGAVWGQLAPVEYFLYQYLKANLLIIAVDVNKLSANGRSKLHLISMYRGAIPAHVTFFVIERQQLGTETYNMAEEIAEDLTPLWVRQLYEVAGPNEYSKIKMSYSDARPVVHWIATCNGEAQ